MDRPDLLLLDEPSMGLAPLVVKEIFSVIHRLNKSSLTSVGYGEVIEVTGNVPAQVFTMILITFGMGIILCGLSTLTALLIEGELSGLLRRKNMEKQIRKLNNHYIVCGGGETGLPMMAELFLNKEDVVLV